MAELKLAQYNGEQNELSIKTLPPLGHDADILCWAQLEDNFYDLFVHDGDAFFYHYWVNSDTQSVQLVRKLATNPDIETCALTDTSLVFSDSV